MVGVNAQIDSETGGNDGVGFAIPSNTVRSIVSRLISSGKVDHAYLGVALQTTASGVRVARVESGTAAERAGLQAGDVITAVDGRKVVTGETLRAAIDAKRPGEKVSLTYTRAGKTHTVRATLGNRPS